MDVLTHPQGPPDPAGRAPGRRGDHRARGVRGDVRGPARPAQASRAARRHRSRRRPSTLTGPRAVGQRGAGLRPATAAQAVAAARVTSTVARAGRVARSVERRPSTPSTPTSGTATSGSTTTSTSCASRRIGTLSEHRADVPAAPTSLADTAARDGPRARRGLADTGGHPVVYADWLHAEGAPDGPRLRPLRRPAGRPARRCGSGRRSSPGSRMAGSSRAAPRTTRARSTSTCGRPGPGWRRRPAAGQPPLRLRGRGGVRLDQLRAWLEANRERLAADLAVDPRHRLLRGQPAGHHDRPARPDVRPDRRHGPEPGPPLGHATAATSRTRPTRWRGSSPRLQDGDGPRHGARLLRRGPRADAARAARSSRALPFDEERPGRADRRARAVRRARPAPLERRGARPTLDVNGIWGGFQGEGTKTIIPAHAHAKVICRLVADMDPQRTFERVRDAILAVARPGRGVEVALPQHHVAPGSASTIPPTQAAARCLSEVFGAEPPFIREGGSIPAAATFDALLGLPVVLLGFTNPDDQAHAPNEVDGARQLRGWHPHDRALLGGPGRRLVPMGWAETRKVGWPLHSAARLVASRPRKPVTWEPERPAPHSPL